MIIRYFINKRANHIQLCESHYLMTRKQIKPMLYKETLHSYVSIAMSTVHKVRNCNKNSSTLH